MSIEHATQQSGETRRARGQLRDQVQDGLSLTLLLRRGQPALERVEIGKLTRWLPGVGSAKARRILLGLPERSHLSELKPSDRAAFIEQIATAESSIIRSRITPAPDWPMPNPPPFPADDEDTQ